MSLLVPEVYGNSSIEDPYAIIYNLGKISTSIGWNGNLLAFGHSDGVTILTPIPSTSKISKSFPSQFQSNWVLQSVDISSIPLGVILLKFNSKFLLTAHEDDSLTLINHLDEQQVDEGGINFRGHTDSINSIDISETGTVVSASDDKTVRIWNDDDGENYIFNTDGIPTLVKFWIDRDFDKVIVVENDNIVRVLDWKRRKWLYTIYPISYSSNTGGSIIDAFPLNEKIVVIGNGWKKTYDPENLRGGAGYTFPEEDVQLNGWLIDSKYIHSSTSKLIGGIGKERSGFYDLGSNNNQSYQFNLSLPSSIVQSGSINQNGIVAIGSGVKLLLLRPFDSYEALQYKND